MHKFSLILALVLGGSWGLASADTLHFNDGTKVDGVVVSEDENFISLQVGKGRMTFPRSDVSQIEKNDKEGDDVKISRETGLKHEQDQQERTGLTREQRDQVRAAISPLWSLNEEERRVARENLKKMGKDLAVFQYIESFLPYSKGQIVPELMTVLVEMDPERARTALSQRTEDPNPVNRAKALELMATYTKDKPLATMARGMIDLDPAVRTTAAEALGKTKEPAVTPALIAGLADDATKDAALAALKKVWADDPAAGQLSDVSGWQSFWGSRSKKVENAVDVAELKPLVSQEELDQAAPGHDE